MDRPEAGMVPVTPPKTFPVFRHAAVRLTRGPMASTVAPDVGRLTAPPVEDSPLRRDGPT